MIRWGWTRTKIRMGNKIKLYKLEFIYEINLTSYNNRKI